MTPNAPNVLQKTVEDIDALRVHLKQDRLLVLGHSWGGLVAMAYVAAYPARMDRLILLGSAGPTTDRTSGMLDRVMASLQPAERERFEVLAKTTPTRGDQDRTAFDTWRTIMPGYFFDRSAALRFAAVLPANTMHLDTALLLEGRNSRRLRLTALERTRK